MTKERRENMEMNPKHVVEIESALVELGSRPRRQKSVLAMFKVFDMYKQAIEMARSNKVGHDKIANVLNQKVTEHGIKVSRRALEYYCVEFLNETPRSKSKKKSKVVATSGNPELLRLRDEPTNKATVKQALPPSALVLKALTVQNQVVNEPSRNGLTQSRVNPAFRKNDSKERPL